MTADRTSDDIRQRAIRLLDGGCRKPYDQYGPLDQLLIDRIAAGLDAECREYAARRLRAAADEVSGACYGLAAMELRRRADDLERNGDPQ